ncbi:mediator of RNA polymerase II transcription subunit 19a-like isoform X2 [Apium graveolens]|uniref:mediator of RNA polymerase II transcription subunit 19a-like isoform X2 n=1 Tax=Apium graveolens TaxID=4045 RepID=UPI003D7A3214
MDHERKNFGRGLRERTGAVDLINQYKLLPHHEFFCKRSLPLSVSDTHYLHNVMGDTEIRKGEGMQLDQLIQTTSYPSESNSEKGTLTIAGKSRSESKEKEKKHKKHKDKDREKDKEHKKHKHRHKDRSKDKDKEKKKDKSSHRHEKKRKHDGDEDINDVQKHKKNKHKSSKIDEMGAVRVPS